jgi:hypothetical protein
MERIQMKDLTIIEISREKNIFLTQSGEAKEKNNMDVNASKNMLNTYGCPFVPLKGKNHEKVWAFLT